MDRETLLNEGKPKVTLKAKIKKNYKSILIGILAVVVTMVVLAGIATMIIVITQLSKDDNAVSLNIHIRTKGCAEEAIKANQQLLEGDKSLAINFKDKQDPHLTLFLSKFKHNSIEDVIDVVKGLAYDYLAKDLSCKITMKPSKIMNQLGNYAMWNAAKPYDCIQNFCNIAVNKLKPFVSNSAREYIPNWVKEIEDEKVREEKEKMIKDYGSPNVFNQYDPHITIGFDNNNQAIFNAAKNITMGTCSFMVTHIGIASVGEGGSVLNNGTIYSIFPEN